MAVKESLRKFGSRFAFEFFLETMHDSVIKGLKKYLSSTRAEDIPSMVRKSRYPSVKHIDSSVVSDNVEHIEKISLLRLMEFIAEARPDLAMEIQNMGDAGAKYLAKLRIHFLDKLRQSAGGEEFKPGEDMVLAHCDKCGKKWPVKREKGAAITKCPFCGTVGDEEKEQPSEDE